MPWLVMSAVLMAGCGQRSVVKDEPLPSAIDVRFDRLPILLAGIRQTDDVSVLEGLPDAFWEPELRGQELRRKKTVRVRGYPFYEETRKLPENDARQLTELLSARNAMSAYSGPKRTGEYNADYCITWKASGTETNALISLECAEVKLYGPKAELHCDLKPEAAKQLGQLLDRYRNFRPVKKQKP
jgi:hypothetical protein